MKSLFSIFSSFCLLTVISIKIITHPNESSFTSMLAYRWGNYKPYNIFALTERDPNPLTVRMAYLYENEDFNEFRYYLNEYTNNLTLNYLHHNGIDFNEQEIIDNLISYKMNFITLKSNIYEEKQAWDVLIETFENKLHVNDELIKMVLSFGIEQLIPNDNYTKPYYIYKEKRKDNFFQIKNIYSNKIISSFQIKIYDQYKNIIDIDLKYKFVSSKNRYNNWNVSNLIQEFLTNVNSNYFQTENVNINSILLIEIPIKLIRKYYIHIEYDEDNFIKSSSKSLSELEYKIIEKKIHFNEKIASTFPSPIGYNKCLNSAFSNLLGGLTYMYGPIYIEPNETYVQPLPLFTGTPSRTKFRISYLWDDGFHNMIICQWDIKLCLDIMNNWLNTVFPSGYLPREQSRGAEAESFQFLKENIKDVNPPTIIFPILYLFEELYVHKTEKTDLRNIYQGLKKWFFFFYESQKPLTKNLFRWSVFENDYYLGSGLDDYPRNDEEFISKFHVDLQVWMILFSEAMIKLGEVFETNINTLNNYRIIYERSKENLNLFFLDPNDQIYKDIGYLKKSFYSKLHFNTHFGYINLFPLFFGLIDENSESFRVLIDKLNDPEILWSVSGIRSLSKNDTYYKKNDDYWTSPVWININYLLLRGLKKYYSRNLEAVNIYSNLRNNIIETVCGVWEGTGFFWENYDDEFRMGKDSHPFNGWTSLITLIISEKYL